MQHRPLLEEFQIGISNGNRLLRVNRRYPSEKFREKEREGGLHRGVIY